MSIHIDDINTVLDALPPITLDEMKGIRLMDRVDSKFVAPAFMLPDLLRNMAEQFKVQTHDGVRLASYTTQYFDTPALDMYMMHHNGKLNRQKIRIRSYVESNLSFLEVKNKNNKGRTKKKRVPVASSHLTSIHDLHDEKTFLSQYSLFDSNTLVPVLANEFQRITLVNNKATERITIDAGLLFMNYKTGIETKLDKLVVLELKQDGQQHSDFKDILLRYRIKKSSFSKYCIGTMLTNPHVKNNRFKKQWILINKKTHDTI
ncbi:MAG: polyphosphate polymerase domain-containing protein [Prevotellaceae bacterium]|jgi:hypothetical protein|nr:polyphosphate polymerase domain-containing protein [Prevotellaceae bacterium]